MLLHCGADAELAELCAVDRALRTQLTSILSDEIVIRCAQSQCLPEDPSDLAYVLLYGSERACVKVPACGCRWFSRGGGTTNGNLATRVKRLLGMAASDDVKVGSR